MTIELIQAAQKGDLIAYEQLIYTHRGTVERFAYQCGASWQDVPDISQEVFIRLYRFLHQFKQDRFTTWLYKVTLNTTRDHYRKETQFTIKEKRFGEQGMLPNIGAEATVLDLEEDQELHRMIQRLDEKYRVPLVLYYFQECSYTEIADILSVTLATVKIRIHRAKDLLRTAYEEQEATHYE
ncbi:RNA polymerase sigma factor [Chryseomicrobium palamuruense]|uniref:RNA polymerase sigma factor n=1 Tax=Chryseomicrobium palamuruense TaxID=682973 RepID=A0ABV8UW78_9BACL